MGDRPLFPKLSFFFLIHSKTWSVPFYTFYTFYIFLFLNSSFIYSQVPEVEATLLHEFNSLDARQGVAVNATHVFQLIIQALPCTIKALVNPYCNGLANRTLMAKN
jgi:hypothetical protein